MAWRNPYKLDPQQPEYNPDEAIRMQASVLTGLNPLHAWGLWTDKDLTLEAKAEPVTYRPKDRSYYKQPVTAFENQLLKDSPEAFYAKKVADRAKVNAQVVTAPKPVNPNAGIINRYNYYETRKHPYLHKSG